jgi:hypothetical protein
MKLFWLFTLLLLVPGTFAQRQQPRKIPRIGYLTGVASAPNKIFLQGLGDLGYFDGTNMIGRLLGLRAVMLFQPFFMSGSARREEICLSSQSTKVHSQPARRLHMVSLDL